MKGCVDIWQTLIPRWPVALAEALRCLQKLMDNDWTKANVPQVRGHREFFTEEAILFFFFFLSNSIVCEVMEDHLEDDAWLLGKVGND